MCDPVSLTVAGLTAAGTVAQQVGQSQARNAQNDAIEAERQRQQKFTTQETNAATNSQQGYTQDNLNQDMSKAQAARTENYTNASKLADNAYLPGQSSAPAVVQQAVESARAQNSNYLGQQASSRAALNSWGDALFNANANAQRNNGVISTAAGQAASSRAVLPAEIQAASQKGAGLRLLGDLATGAGLATGLAGGSGKLSSLFSSGSGFNDVGALKDTVQGATDSWAQPVQATVSSF